MILNDPRQRILDCKVDLSGFPGDRLILDVDKLVTNDTFVNDIIKASEQRCDLIVFHTRSGVPSATLLEAKGTRYEAFGDELKAVGQLRSSHTVLQRALNHCNIDLPQFSVTGAIVTGSMNSGAWAQSDLLIAIREAEIEIELVPSGFDVYRQMFGGY